MLEHAITRLRAERTKPRKKFTAATLTKLTAIEISFDHLDGPVV